MSHFTVLVIGPNPEEQLAPYDENVGVEPYKRYYTEDDVVRMADFYKLDPTDLAALATKLPDWDGGEGGVEDGRLFCWRTYNPLSKWDWYSLGGRWTGFLKLKAGGEGGVSEPGLLTAAAEEGTADCARKGDIDFAGMRDEAAARALTRWDRAHELMGDAFKTYESWEVIRGRHEGIDNARAEYHAQPAVIALRADDQFAWKHYDVMCSREECERAARRDAVVTFAVVKDGEWFERGRMGWWGVVSDEKERDAWAEEFAKLLDELPDDTLLSVYDCHI